MKAITLDRLKWINPLLACLFLTCGFSGHAQKKKDIKSIEIKTENTEKLSPGSRFQVGASTTLYNGKTKATKEIYDGNLNWKKLKVDVVGGSFKDGYITVSDDVLKLKDHKVTVIVSDAEKNKVSESLSVTLNFMAKQTCDLSGKAGDSGLDGSDGTDGSKNETGDGTDGTQGLPGGSGDMGHTAFVNVVLVTIDSNNQFLKVLVEDFISNKKMRYLINTKGEGLIIDASGGVGGTGGDGGNGGDGRDVSEEHSNPGNGGAAGNGGPGGPGGDAGDLTVYFDQTAVPFKHLIQFNLEGGAGGEGGDNGKRSKGGYDPDSKKSTLGKIVTGSGGKRGSRGDNGMSGIAGKAGKLEINEGAAQVDF